MANNAKQDAVRQGLASMIAFESWLEDSLNLPSSKTKKYLETPVIIKQLRLLVTKQRKALQAHLKGLGNVSVPPTPQAISTAFEVSREAQSSKRGQEMIATLRNIATAFAQAAFGYAVLHGLAHRFYDVATADLADQHRTNYLQATQSIHLATGDVVIQELQEAGHACRCECPSCSPGICLCWHVHLMPPTEGIVVRAPRAQSNAEKAGLRHGDVILAVEGQKITSYQDMLDSMREYQPGESVKLRIQRGTSKPRELIIIR